jgi:hypothetical protein
LLVLAVAQFPNLRYRAKNGLEPFSYTVVKRFKQIHPALVSQRRGIKVCDIVDSVSFWAMIMVALVLQILKMLVLSTLTAAARALDLSPLPPIYLQDVVWRDEKHRNIVLSHMGQYKVRSRREAFGKLASEADGG